MTDQPQVFKCPNCGHPYRVGELVCEKCNLVFATDGRTQKFNDPQNSSGDKTWPTGEVIASDKKPISFEINGARLPLAIQETLVLGRNTGNSSEQPDVDLSEFNAEYLGVSRLHIRIRRKGILLYVSDLNSTNGTQLNGRRLIPDGERLIRDGDELILGRLKIKVRF